MEKKGIDWDQVQRERDGGATTTALAEKYGCSTPTICAHTQPAKARNGNAVRSNGNHSPASAIDAAIAELKQRRNEIDAAIATLGKLA